LHVFGKVKKNARRPIQKIKLHPWNLKSAPIEGFVQDVKMGRL